MRILQLCFIYLSKHHILSFDDDLIFYEEIREHFSSMVIPYCFNNVSNRLIRNGQFLCAYTLFCGRVNNSI